VVRTPATLANLRLAIIEADMKKARVGFIEPMLLQAVSALPDDRSRWLYQLKIDGYRAIAYKQNGTLYLRSRNDNDFSSRYPSIAKALTKLPADTVIDGEIVALGEDGRPSFNLLQNHGSTHPDLFYYVFDVMMLGGKDICQEPLEARIKLLESKVLPKLSEPVRPCAELEADLLDLVRSVREQALEGLVAKHRDSVYESGRRSGAWQKMRINQGQELVIGGFTPGPHGFDALVLGYYEKGKLLYASRTRNGFTPTLRQQLYRKMRPLIISECPFANLPEPRGGRWGAGLTAAKMKDILWLKPEMVGQFEFVEWTPDAHLRHTKFVALREDKKAKDVGREVLS
jgi:bifunctional non-homologous end joining protein LigD